MATIIVLQLIKLPEHIQAVLQQGKLHYTKVNEILKVKDLEQQRQLLEKAIAQEFSVSEIQSEVKALRQAKTTSDVADPDEIPLSPGSDDCYSAT